MAEIDIIYDVIIIGGGISGVAAANRLIENHNRHIISDINAKKLNVLLLEADNRLGY